MDLRILVIGDIVGKPGRRVLEQRLPAFIEREKIDFVIANAENASGGAGLTPNVADRFLSLGIDVLTGGDHTFQRREIFPMMQENARVLRPANYPEGTVGRGVTVVESRGGHAIGIINALGRVFMPPMNCPFHEIERCLRTIASKTSTIFVDFHAEATSEKVAMGWYLDGRVSAVVGTHTHIQTADERILPKGTAYLTDLGMTGAYDSVIGREKDCVLRRFVTQLPTKYEMAEGDEKICGAVVVVDAQTGKARSIERVQVQGDN
ncbi:MAG: TIGR00282 family metallophosphoesterase [Planctomycetes bacterium]|nr:TIGR00282 family metallophosphoesterase [Planctomycetota bacterium]MBI3847478.1 TIGR00282 family metallophosphoesterase [Planctomycetota bacterium]